MLLLSLSSNWSETSVINTRMAKRAVLLRNDRESRHCHSVTVCYACKIKNVTQQPPAEDLMTSKLKPAAFYFARWQCKHVCLQGCCSAGLQQMTKWSQLLMLPSPCQITPGLIGKERFRTFPCFASLDNLLITPTAYYFRVQGQETWLHGANSYWPQSISRTNFWSDPKVISLYALNFSLCFNEQSTARYL